MSRRAHYTGSSRTVSPSPGQNTPRARHELCLLGPWSPEQVRVISTGRREAVFLGECLAPEHLIRRLLAGAIDARTATDRLGSLEGSYCVVVTEGEELAWAGDLAGLHRLWFRQEPDGVRFASSPTSLTGLEASVPDIAGLAAFLFFPDLIDLLGTSPVQGAVPVGPHQLLHVRQGKATPRDRTPPAPTATLAEGAKSLRSALMSTLGRHRRTAEVSCDLSGGLDSSTIAVLTARTTRCSVQALTYTDPFVRNDDLDHARRIAGGSPGLEWKVVQGNATTLPFCDLESSPRTDVPSLDPLIWARTRARLAPASRDGVHLVGDGGDVVLGAPLTYLAELARPQHARRFLAEMNALARLRQRPAHRVLRAGVALACTDLRSTLTDLAHRLHHTTDTGPGVREPLEAGITWSKPSKALAWTTPHLREDFAERLSGLATSLRPEHEGADAHARRMIHRHSDATRSFVALADQLGVSVRAPFFDNSVVAACMSVAARERATALEAKPLLRAAVSDVMPGELYARRTKGDYGGCEYQGLRRNAARVRDLLREARLFDLRIVRPDPVIRALDSAIDGGTAPMAALHGVLAVETWLRAQDTRSDHPHRRVSRLPIGASP